MRSIVTVQFIAFVGATEPLHLQFVVTRHHKVPPTFLSQRRCTFSLRCQWLPGHGRHQQRVLHCKAFGSDCPLTCGIAICPRSSRCKGKRSVRLPNTANAAAAAASKLDRLAPPPILLFFYSLHFLFIRQS